MTNIEALKKVLKQGPSFNFSGCFETEDCLTKAFSQYDNFITVFVLPLLEGGEGDTITGNVNNSTDTIVGKGITNEHSSS